METAMTCDDANNLIAARLDGELTADDRAALDAHLETCAACREVSEAMLLQDAALTRAFGERRRGAAAVAERVIGLLDAQAPTKTLGAARATAIPIWLRTGLAAAAGFALAVLVLRPWAKPPAPVVKGEQSSTTVQAVATAQPVGALSVATGAVFVCPKGDDQWRRLESGGDVTAGMKVKTGPSVRCEFRMHDGSEVRLNTDTEVTLTSSRRVEVAGGQVFSSVAKASEAFVVDAAPAQTTLTALGTQFDVTCSPARATLTVVEGSVKVESQGAADVIKGGEGLTISDGRFADKRQIDSLVNATQWVDEILVMKGRDNKELAKRIDDLFAQLGQSKMSYMYAQEVRRLGDHCVIPLTRFIQSDRSRGGDPHKRREAARIVSDVATSWAIPELINLLADDDGEVRYAAAKALQRLTNTEQGRTPEQWRDQAWMTCVPTIERWHAWWDQNKTRFPGADPNGVRPLADMKKG